MAKGHVIKRGKIWYARFYDDSGKRHWASLKTKSRLEAYARFTQFILPTGRQGVSWQIKEKSVSEFASEYLGICEVEHAKRTFRVERQALRKFVRFAGVRYLHQITAAIIEAYKVKRANEVRNSTVNRALAIIKAFLNKAIRLGYLEKNPAQFVKKLKEEQLSIKHLNAEEIRKLMEVCTPKMKEVITIFLLTGMRLGELTHLRWQDIDFQRKMLHVQNQPDWTTKSYKSRVIPMHPAVEHILNTLPHKANQTYVFESRTGKTIEHYIRREIFRFSKKAGVHASVKMFRSTFASNLVMAGENIYAVSKLLGHHDVKITEKHYAHLTPNFLSETVSRLNPPTSNPLIFH